VGILTTEIQWRSSHNNEVRPFPQMIAKPDEDNTTSAAYNLYQTRLNEVTLFRDDQRRLKDIMICSLGEDVATMLRDPAKGFAHLDLADILFKLKEQFGDLSEVDILTIKNQAENEIISAKMLPGQICKMKSKFAQLENAHQGLSEVEKMTILTTATSKFPTAVICLQRYKTKYSKLKTDHSSKSLKTR
jgi:hypothetical protein